MTAMNVLVIGSTGLTGRLCVEKLVAAGHNVTALARQPADLADMNPRLKVVQGTAEDAASLERAVAGQEAVVIAFGPRSFKKSDVQEKLMRHLLPALKKHAVKRVVNLSAWGAGDSRSHSNWVLRLLLLTRLRHVYADKERGEALLLAGGIPYVNVRPGQLLNTPARGGVKATLDSAGLKPVLSRADLSDFMVAQLSDDTWVNKSPLLGY